LQHDRSAPNSAVVVTAKIRMSLNTTTFRKIMEMAMALKLSNRMVLKSLKAALAANLFVLKNIVSVTRKGLFAGRIASALIVKTMSQ